MRKYIKLSVLVLGICILMGTFSGCESDYKPPEGMRVAMISTPADISDESFNQILYTEARDFCEEVGVPFTYYRSMEETTDAYLSVIDAAINDDYNVIVLSGYLTARAARLAAEANPDVKFVVVDVSAEDFGKNYVLPDNLCCWVFKEEYAGYMAGYAAVKEGYRHIGYMGGVAGAPVVKYGYGYVIGADDAAKELNADVEIEYVYANQFYGDADITAYMQTWYETKKVEVIFSCAGAAWTSVATVAKAKDKKVIGVDIDQTDIINKYTGKDTSLTSAMKGLAISERMALDKIYQNKWSEISGSSASLGLVSDNPDENYVQLPTKNWSMKKFTLNDYKKLVKELHSRERTISVDITKPPETKIKVNYYGSIK